MCGFVGYCSSDMHDAQSALTRMLSRLVHRGPDNAGTWIDPDAGIGLGHRRLSVLDLSSAGHQPMISVSGRFVIAYNGEIYSHNEIRAQLESTGAAPSWRGHSDTETLLAAIEAWGVERSLRAANGMFAFALWDRELRQLTLARDRFGEKPLYFGIQKNCFLFGSELKALREHSAFERDLDRNAVALFLRFGAVPAPRSIYKGIRKLAPGTHLTIRFGSEPVSDRHLSPTSYWTLADSISRGRESPFDGTLQEAGDRLASLASETIRNQMLSDVPLGAFLSGGVDSSTIVALMQSQSSRPIKTFTIGFDEVAFSEAVNAREVARHLGTDHTEMTLSSDDALALIPELAEVWCEPFADASQIPTLLVSKLARRDVTVALSGDGGDEVFGGYNRHIVGPALWRRMRRVPIGLRSTVARLLSGPRQRTWDQAYRLVGSFLPQRYQVSKPGFKLHKLAGVLAKPDVESLYRGMVSHWQNPGQVVLGASESETILDHSCGLPPTADVGRWMMAVDTLSYLPDDILTKVDRAAMSVSLETRIPFLDHRIVEFAWTLPHRMKIADGRGKVVLREVLYRYVPKKIIERPKAGFEVPIGQWLRGQLRPWAQALLDENRIRNEGVLDPSPITQMWTEHQSGKRNWQYQLWDILMFQEWYSSQ